MNYKCKKCNSKLNKSRFSQMTGYESYRCSNSECNSLFDISDFSNNTSFKSNNYELNMPDSLNPYHEIYFETLRKDSCVKIDLGAGKTMFTLKVCDANDCSMIVCSSDAIKKQFVSEMKKMYTSKMIKNSFEHRILNFNEFINLGIKNDKLFLFNELFQHQDIQLRDLIEEHYDFRRRCYFVYN